MEFGKSFFRDNSGFYNPVTQYILSLSCIILQQLILIRLSFDSFIFINLRSRVFMNLCRLKIFTKHLNRNKHLYQLSVIDVSGQHVS